MARLLNIMIPKKFDSKTVLREYIQSKDFIVTLKTRINTILYSAINESNGFTQAELANMQNTTTPGNIS
jgi:hypothetical protein